MTTKSALERHRTGSLNLRIDPKIKYLADIAARHHHLPLWAFIEKALANELTPSRVEGPEPNVSEPTGPMHTTREPLWGDDLWDDCEATRMFRLAVTHPDLLNLPQMKMWTMLTGAMMKQDGKISLRRFVEWYNSPGFNTAHLEASRDGGE